eukprot:4917021-Prymnesium_polylepis.1
MAVDERGVVVGGGNVHMALCADEALGFGDGAPLPSWLPPTCSGYLVAAANLAGSSVGAACLARLNETAVGLLRSGVAWTPPPDRETFADVCRATCGAAGVGPCGSPSSPPAPPPPSPAPSLPPFTPGTACFDYPLGFGDGAPLPHGLPSTCGAYLTAAANLAGSSVGAACLVRLNDTAATLLRSG